MDFTERILEMSNEPRESDTALKEVPVLKEAPAKKTDRRILRTRRMMRDALLSLMEEKEFSQISAKDITDRADLNRGTFYLHYSSPEDLLKHICYELLDEMEQTIDDFEPQQPSESLKTIVGHIVSFIERDPVLFRSLLDNLHNEAMVQGIAHMLLEKGLQIRGQQPSGAVGRRMAYSSYFITYGIVAVIRQWFRRDCDLSPQELQEYIYQFVSPIVDLSV